MIAEKFIVIYTTDSGEKNFVEFKEWSEAYEWCNSSIMIGTSHCAIHWISKTEEFRVKHVRLMSNS